MELPPLPSPDDTTSVAQSSPPRTLEQPLTPLSMSPLTPRTQDLLKCVTNENWSAFTSKTVRVNGGGSEASSEMGIISDRDIINEKGGAFISEDDFVNDIISSKEILNRRHSEIISGKDIMSQKGSEVTSEKYMIERENKVGGNVDERGYEIAVRKIEKDIAISDIVDSDDDITLLTLTPVQNLSIADDENIPEEGIIHPGLATVTTLSVYHEEEDEKDDLSLSAGVTSSIGSKGKSAKEVLSESVPRSSVSV